MPGWVQRVRHFQDLFPRRSQTSKRESRIFQIPNSRSWQVASCKLYGELLIVVWQRNKSRGFILSPVQSAAECSKRAVPHFWSMLHCKCTFTHWALVVKMSLFWCMIVWSYVSLAELYLLFKRYYSDSKLHFQNVHAISLLHKDVWIKDLIEGLLVIINITLHTAGMS